MKAWHFVGDTLRNGDPIPKNGKKLIFPRKPILCEQGLHASLEPFDAMKYAPGNTLCLVEVGGIIVQGNDKLVATERTILCRIDAEELLRYYARMQALSVSHLWDIPNVALEYLMTGDKSLREAASAEAAEAARSAAWSAARASTAWTWVAEAREAAAKAAEAAASAWEAAEAAEAARSAAWSAARASTAWTWAAEAREAAAWAAAWAAARADFNELVYESFSEWLED